jgi:LCP family protein required for cell wall assembly
MSDVQRIDPPRPIARRTAGQRVLLVLGTVAVVALLTGAAAVAWTAAKFNDIEREDVLLDRLTGAPANYLIVGSDSRERGNPNDDSGRPVEQRAALADTMMIVRVDPEAETVRLLSLPRDLWVTLPNGEEGRLNAAYAHGPQGLVDTIRDELEIPIHHYIEVDFRGFQDVVGAIGGVPMWFDTPMKDYQSGLVIPEAGCITLDGEQALAFARARHLRYFQDGRYQYDGTGDLGRISRQQLFIAKVLDRATDQGYTNPMTMRRLVEAGVEHVTLDSGLSVGTLIGVGERFADFGSESLESYTVPWAARTTSGGASVLEIRWKRALPILKKFGGPGTRSTTATTFVPVTEPFDVTVLNSSGVPGRAEQVATELRAAGIEVPYVGNGFELGHVEEPATVVRYAVGFEDEARTVAAELHVTDVAEADDLAANNVVVFLGTDDGSATTTTVPSTSTTTAASGTTTTTAPKPVGVLPGETPAGESCG